MHVCQRLITGLASNKAPFRQVPVDGIGVINCDVYSHALGYGKAIGISTVSPSADVPGKFRVVTRNAFTFP